MVCSGLSLKLVFDSVRCLLVQVLTNLDLVSCYRSLLDSARTERPEDMSVQDTDVLVC
mgnify:CR=1 FL=1